MKMAGKKLKKRILRHRRGDGNGPGQGGPLTKKNGSVR